MMPAPRVLCIAGTDPSGGAGLLADIKSVAANGGYGMGAVAALTAQNTRGVRGVHVPPPSFLADQLHAISDDITIDAVKIGMLGTAEVAATVGEWLTAVRPPVVVLDPVMVATSGDRLLDVEAEVGIRALFDRVDLITPNAPELAVLADVATATEWPDLVGQALAVSATYGVLVLAKGGHLGGEVATDALVDAGGRLSDGRSVVEFAAPRVDTPNTHGTGCALSSALATLRPQVADWEEATDRAKRWLSQAIQHGAELAVGGGHGPVHHFAELWPTSAKPAENRVRRAAYGG
ncbi:MAG TPA: bifunctional hydroxymethylpyrimidine kinase/phosphomethylpyrimidine kinase [Propionibacteriaceae bacterium]|jgi:hydroxymethylpyrimidine kinase/phosphomethylpyrimidine kinase|nr:bifunctional hydroxymethylpyrimidine kinase/phosphomethylpyrimidine kinase [Propionibacteriaceae bacterium]